MGTKPAKKTKLVKERPAKERPANSKSANEERVSIVRQPPSPIPEEAENAFVAQGSAHEESNQTDHRDVGSKLTSTAPAPGAWYASPRQSGAASPRTEDYGPHSWAGKSDSSSMSRDAPRRPSSPYPIAGSVGLDQDDTRSTGEDELDYVSYERSGMDSNSNMQQQWNAAQDQSQAQLPPPPQTQQEQPPPTGTSFNIYAKSFSNPPVAPNPLPSAPNVVSKASEAAARMDRSKKGDPPPQPPQVLPLPPAAWHNWIKPGTYAPKPEPPAPPPAPPQAPPSHPPPHPAPAFGPAVAGSIPKGHLHNSTRGIWDLKHGKGLPANAQMHQSRGRTHEVSGQWGQPRSRSSVDGWAAQPGGGGLNAWNGNGLGAASESGGWAGNDGGNRGHGRGRSEGGQGRKRNVQWEEESSSEETDDDNDYDDGWGEQGASGRGQGGGGQAQWSKPDNAWGGLDQGGGGQAQWPKPDNTWGGRDQSGGGQAQWSKPDNTWSGRDQGGGGQAHWSKPDNAWGGLDQGGGGQAQWSKPDNAWGGRDQGGGGQAQRSKPDSAWGGLDQGGGGQAQWSKPDNAWGGRDQGGWNQGGGGLGHQSANEHSWGEGRKSHYAADAPAAAADTRGMVSPQQKAQILNSFLNMSNMPNQMQAGQAGHAEHRTGRLASKRTRKESKGQTQHNAGWGWGDESWRNTHVDEDSDEDEEDEEEHRPRASTSKRVSNSWGAWGGSQEASRYSMPSLTLAHAYKDKDIKTRLDSGDQSKLDDFTRIRFHESRGAALVQAQTAFFGGARLARDRIHWSFPPDKDERVRAAFTWVQDMAYGLATLGLHKYLQHRERGALLINADYRPPDQPEGFAVDYLPFDDLQHSRDQTLQVSVISYNPATTVIVFVFLPSKTGNSIAIWRRKLLVPNNVRLRFQKELGIALFGLKNPQQYEVHVEEDHRTTKVLPNPPKLVGDQAKPKKKRKWWQLFKLFKSS